MKNIMNRLIAMLYKEFIYLIRDKKMRIIIIAVPIIQAVLLGYAVNMDLKEVKTAVVNMDNSIESNEFIDSFFQAIYLHQFQLLICIRQKNLCLVAKH